MVSGVGKAASAAYGRRDGRSSSESKSATRKGAIRPPAVSLSAVLYDAAVLVAADRNDRRAWAEHKARLEFGIVPLAPAPVVAQVSRFSQQVQLRRFLTGCEVVPLGEREAHEAGRLLGLTRTADVVDAAVAAIAVRRRATVLTSDTDDIKRLVGASAGREIEVLPV